MDEFIDAHGIHLGLSIRETHAAGGGWQIPDPVTWRPNPISSVMISGSHAKT